MYLTAVGNALFMLVTCTCISCTKLTSKNGSSNATGKTSSFPEILPSHPSSVSSNSMSVSAATLPVATSRTPSSHMPTVTSSMQPTTQEMMTKLSTTKMMTVSSTKSPSVKADDDNAPVITLAVIAAIAAVVALVFLILYLRTSHSCYQLLHRSNSTPSPDAFQLSNVRSSSNSFPIRNRLASLSSIRRNAICKSEPFSITEFHAHVKRLHADSDYLFSLEYEAVGGKKYLNDTDKKQELTTHEGKNVNHKNKNRYTDILPYDHSRVVLTEIDKAPDSTYINANYVDSYRKPKAYIAAQGPLTASLNDFWRMIWESNSRVIVMVTNLFERTKSKCVQYWPDKDSTNYGLLTVTMIKQQVFADYVIRTLSVEPAPNQLHYTQIESESKTRVIQQFHFTEWPDHDVPVHRVALLRFIRQSKAANPTDAGPPVIHCSAGVGRSGVYMIIDSMMERIADDGTVDVFNFLNHIRTQRIALVQEESQYIFVHDCILEHIDFGDTNVPIKQFHKRLESLRKVNPGKKKSRLREEFENIERTKILEKHKWAGKKTCNEHKNRRKDILPVERTRVKLPLVLGIDGADYINASYIDGFTKKREYIVTQAPMVKTGESFYRMICSTNCSVIVMLMDDEQWKKDDYADLPTEDETVICGKFEIHLESQDISEKVTVRKLRLFSSETSDGHTITHYHYRDWPSGGFPKDKTSLVNFMEQVREHKAAQSSQNPITILCDYGVGPSGVFCLASYLYEQIEREKCADVFCAAKLFRVQRPKLIETEEQYAFCYDVVDQIISRKLVSMTDDSDSDDLPGNRDGKDSATEAVRNHSPRMNGSVVTSDSSTASPKIGHSIVSKTNPGESKICPPSGMENKGARRDSPVAGNDSTIVDTGSANTENPITKSESVTAASGIPRIDCPEISDVDEPDTSSSQKALLSSPSSSM